MLTARLRFDTEAEEAASFYVGIFKGSRLGGVHQHTEAAPAEVGYYWDDLLSAGGQAPAGA